MTYEEWCKNELGYETKTTYFMDFSIAEKFGENAIRDTFRRAMKNTQVEYITELCMVLNHKIWFTYEKNKELGKIYNELWEQCQDWCYENLKGADLQYFVEVTD